MAFINLKQKFTYVNLKKLIRFFRRNGLVSSYYMTRERISNKEGKYIYNPIGDSEFDSQRDKRFDYEPLISIVVPAYETNVRHLEEMVNSVLGQSYIKLELVIVDASESDTVKNELARYRDVRIRYKKIDNIGISSNTNYGIDMARGQFVGLLDHDDILTLDALYVVVEKLNTLKKEGREIKLIYSDEDKYNDDNCSYFEPHYKMDFNYDLFLTNNYMCHFTLIERKIITGLRFRDEYNGAQDFDMFLRAVGSVEEEQILHIGKVLYHWRSHDNSTSTNPESKLYAYEAGRLAIEDYLKSKGINSIVENTKHLGFYRVRYENVLQEREDIAAYGEYLYKRNIIIGGAYDINGNVLYKGMNRHCVGYMNRVILHQNVYALDVRSMYLNCKYSDILIEIIKNNVNLEDDDVVDYISEYVCVVKSSIIEKLDDILTKKIGMEFAKSVHESGLKLLLYPGER